MNGWIAFFGLAMSLVAFIAGAHMAFTGTIEKCEKYGLVSYDAALIRCSVEKK